MAMVDIRGLDKAEVVLALWNASQMQGMSFLGYHGEMSLEQIRADIEERKHKDFEGNDSIYFDYLNGKVMKVDVGQDEFDPRLFDCDCGEGTAQRAIDNLRLSKCFNANGEAKFADVYAEVQRQTSKNSGEE